MVTSVRLCAGAKYVLPDGNEALPLPEAGRTARQGLTLVHFSALREHFLWDAWVPAVDIWVITRHNLDKKRPTYQGG